MPFQWRGKCGEYEGCDVGVLQGCWGSEESCTCRFLVHPVTFHKSLLVNTPFPSLFSKVILLTFAEFFWIQMNCIHSHLPYNPAILYWVGFTTESCFRCDEKLCSSLLLSQGKRKQGSKALQRQWEIQSGFRDPPFPHPFTNLLLLSLTMEQWWQGMQNSSCLLHNITEQLRLAGSLGPSGRAGQQPGDAQEWSLTNAASVVLQLSASPALSFQCLLIRMCRRERDTALDPAWSGRL